MQELGDRDGVLLNSMPNNISHFLGGKTDLGHLFRVIADNQVAQVQGSSVYPNEANELETTAGKISNTWDATELSESALDTKISFFKKLRTVANNPSGWIVLVVGVGCSYYFLIDNWDQSTKEEREKDSKLLAAVTAVIVGATVQGLFNIGTRCFNRVKSVFKEKKSELTEKKGAASVIFILTEIVENHLHHPCSRKLREHIQHFVRFFETDFPGKNLLSPDLLFNLGQASALAKKHLENTSELELKDGQDPRVGTTHCLEVDDFLRKEVLPLLYAECHKLGIPNVAQDFLALRKWDGLSGNQKVQSQIGQTQESVNQNPEVEIEIPINT